MNNTIIFDPSIYTVDNADLTVSILMGNSIGLKRLMHVLTLVPLNTSIFEFLPVWLLNSISYSELNGGMKNNVNPDQKPDYLDLHNF